jgi:hypothetical protein
VTGGLMNAGSVFMLPLQKAVERRAPAATIVESRLPPVLGGVLLALEMLGGAVTSGAVDRLVASSSRRAAMCVA